MALADWTSWETAAAPPHTDPTRRWSEALDSTVVASGGEGASLRWSAVSGASGWVGKRYSGIDAGSFPNKYLLASAAIRTQGAFGSQDIFGFLLHGKVAYSGTPSLSSVEGIFVGIDGITVGGTGSLRTYVVDNGGFNPELSNSTIPLVSNGFVQFQAAVLWDDTKPLPAIDLVRVYYRWNTGVVLTKPGSAGWTGWSNRGQLSQSNFTTFISDIAGGSRTVSMVRGIPSGWGGGSFSAVWWDKVSIDIGVIV